MTALSHQIVYISRAATNLDEKAINAIWEISISKNRQNGVTGLLVFDGSRFLQAIEGERATVKATMDRIGRDGRHNSVDIVCDRPIAAPQFGSWSMDYKRAEPGTCSRAFLEAVKNNVATVDDPALQAIFIGFAYLGSRPARAG